MTQEQTKAPLQSSTRRPLIGMRTIKTVIAALIAAVLMKYVFHQTPFFACIGAVVAVERTILQSLRASIIRNVGTITGGVMGILVSAVTDNLLLISLGLIPMICIENFLKKQESIVVGAIVYFAVVYLNMSGGSLEYGFTRILCTLIGSFVGLAVNMLICPPKKEA